MGVASDIPRRRNLTVSPLILQLAHHFHTLFLRSPSLRFGNGAVDVTSWNWILGLCIVIGSGFLSLSLLIQREVAALMRGENYTSLWI